MTVGPETALQKALRARLIATPAVIALLPAPSILDRHERPAPSPSIVIGEAIARDEGDTISRSRVTVFADLHLWKKEASLEGVKAIAGAIRLAIKVGRLDALEGFTFPDCLVASTRFLRDPDGETSHGVVTIEARVEEV